MADPDTDPVPSRIAVRDRQFVIDIPDSRTGLVLKTVSAGSMDALLDIQRHEPIRSGELEQLIAVIEDQLVPVLKLLGQNQFFVTADPGLQRVAVALGRPGTADAVLERESVEQLFNRLADIAGGVPPSQRDVPIDRHFTLHLVWLRELMHHANVRQLKLIS